MYDYVHFNRVSNEGISSFLQFIKFDDLTPKIWQSIANRKNGNDADDNPSDSSINNQRYAGKLFEYGYNKKDIMKYLKYYAEIDEEIKFTASSVKQVNYDMTSLIKGYYISPFMTYDEVNPWICIEFKKHSLTPTNYTLQSTTYSSTSNVLKSWVVEGSNDKSNWTIIDEHNDCNSLKNGNSHTFSIKKQINIKYFRIRMTGPNWDGDDILKLISIEIFGKLN